MAIGLHRWVLGACLLWSLLAPAAVSAQETLSAATVAALPDQVYLDRAAFLSVLEQQVPGFRPGPENGAGSTVPADPYLWVIQGAFGAPGYGVAAGLVHCARYGLETRDLLAAHQTSDPAVFPLVNALRTAGDDALVWPEDAVALMRCSFSWDDARRIAPWAKAEAVALLTPSFAQIARTDDAALRAASGDHIRAQYGVEGFRLDGRDGPRSSYAWIEGMTIVRQLSHQRVSLRVFLLGGGV